MTAKPFKKSVGLNGVGTKAVNALSDYFCIESFRDGKSKKAEFKRGILKEDLPESSSEEANGTRVEFVPDESIFKHYRYISDYLINQIWNYAFLNSGLTIHFNGHRYFSKNGLLDLLQSKVKEDQLNYPICHFKSEDIEIAISHTDQYGEEYYSFVNGQNTTQGGTHLSAFKESIVKTVRDFYKKDFEASDIRGSIVSAVSVRIQEPVFESQTKTKLGSSEVGPDGPTLRTFVNDFLKNQLDNYLHKNPETADALLKRILQTERERKDMAGVRKLAKTKAKKANLHNKKLRDCRVHKTDIKHDAAAESTLFITEGDSASGSSYQVS